MGNEFNEYIAKNAFWIYSYDDTSIVVRVDKKISYSNLDLYKGWNLIPITEDMIGGYLSDIKGDCEFEKLYIWDAESQQWSKIDVNYAFSGEDINYGFLVKSLNFCSLSGVAIISPPPMPE